MKFATCTIAYNEEQLIGGLLAGMREIHNLVLIGRPWRGKHVEFDNTGNIATAMDAEVILQDFDCQQDERNFGMDYLEKSGYEYVLIIDADEYYTHADIQQMIAFVITSNGLAYRNTSSRVYWKSWKWYYEHGGYTACLHSSERFSSKRGVSCKVIDFPQKILMHHFTYERNAEEMRIKAATREYQVLNDKWLKKYWDNWKPGDSSWKKMKESIDIPDEILSRYIKSKAGMYAKT